MIRIKLPWPKPDLWPNSRASRFEVARAKKAYRSGCGWEALQAMNGRGYAYHDRITLRLTFCPPDNRRRDMDNMLAAMKAGIDGVADALRVDDSRFDYQLYRGDPCKGGAVIFEVVTTQEAITTIPFAGQING